MTRPDRRIRDALRREARGILHGGPPTVGLLRPVGPDIPLDERVIQVLDLCLQVGEVLLSSGEAASDTSTTMTRLAGACVLATGDVDITFTSIIMGCRRGRAARLRGARRRPRRPRKRTDPPPHDSAPASDHPVGIIPLLLGLTVYRGFYQLAASGPQYIAGGLVAITLALAIALASPPV